MLAQAYRRGNRAPPDRPGRRPRQAALAAPRAAH